MTAMLSENAPLQGHRLVDTRSVEEARDAIGRIFCPHFLNPAERRPAGFRARHHCVPQPGYSINFVSYGATVDIDPGELSRFFLLQIPLKGSARVRCGTSVAETVAGRTASVLSPTLATRMTWGEGCEKLIVLIEREAMERQFHALVGRKTASIEFDAGLDLTSAAGQALLRHVEMTRAAAEQGASMPEAYRVMLRDGLTTLLLAGFAHSASHGLVAPAPAALPASVRRAEEFMRQNVDRPISSADIAAHAGASLRSLQDAFRRGLGTTIGDYLQNLRLERFRAALIAPDEATTVADAAFSAGLGHLGRAAQAYRQRFGESPSQTLSRRR